MTVCARRYWSVADFSLALINRTGAIHLCHDVLQCLPRFFVAMRYWRSFWVKEPTGLMRCLLGRAAPFELNHLRLGDRISPPRSDTATLFLDPLYAIRILPTERHIVLCYDVRTVTKPELFDRRTAELHLAAYRNVRLSKHGMDFVSEASRRND